MLAFDHDKSDSVEANTQFYHRFIEACKFGFGLRYLIGDDNFDDATDVMNKKSRILSELSVKLGPDLKPVKFFF